MLQKSSYSSTFAAEESAEGSPPGQQPCRMPLREGSLIALLTWRYSHAAISGDSRNCASLCSVFYVGVFAGSLRAVSALRQWLNHVRKQNGRRHQPALGDRCSSPESSESVMN